MKTDAPEFQQLYDAFQPKIRRYLAGIVGPGEAEDLTQDVFLKAVQALPGFKSQSTVSTWLYRIATNAALDKLRRPSFRWARAATAIGAQEADAIGIDEDDAAMADETPSADEQLMRDEMRGCVMDLVEKLPPIYRAVVVLSELEGLKNSEIAELLGVTLETVKIRLHRARASLREALQQHSDFHRDGLTDIGGCRRGPGLETTRDRLARHHRDRVRIWAGRE